MLNNIINLYNEYTLSKPKSDRPVLIKQLWQQKIVAKNLFHQSYFQLKFTFGFAVNRIPRL